MTRATSGQPATTQDLPPVLIQITRTQLRAEGAPATITTPYLNPGMSAKDAARYAAGGPGPDLAYVESLTRLGRILGPIGAVVAVVAVTAIIASLVTGAPARILDVNLDVVAYILGVAYVLLVIAAALGLRILARRRRRSNPAAASTHLTALASLDRYPHYDDAETLILTLQASRDAASTLYGDGRERVVAALLEALAILHEYATTIKPHPRLRTSAHNAVEAVSIIARQEGARP